ncbi:hypothetical protein ACW17M_03965 [Vreelandella sp. 2A-K22]
MTRFILREQYRHLVIPRPDLGLFCSRKNAKRAAKRRGYPFELIFKVKRHERSEH